MVASDWTDVAMSQRMLETSRSWKRQRIDFPLEHLKGTNFVDTLILAL